MAKQKELEPKNKHKVSVTLEMTAEEAQRVQARLNESRSDKIMNDDGEIVPTNCRDLADVIEIKREIAIMEEVKKNGGMNGGIEKTLEKWSKEQSDPVYVKETKGNSNRYKLKYR